MGTGKVERQKAKGKGQNFQAQGASLAPLDSSRAARYLSLVLTGFMGTGKTTVGRIVAEKLGREFVDMDGVIEEREGKSVGDIFETRGEPYFRARESELCAELAARKGIVVATGGGALVDAGNRERFADAFVVCLDAGADEIMRRLNGAMNRPLLANGDARWRIEELLAARRESYARIERHVDTNGKSAEIVAEEIVTAFEEAVA